MAKRSNVNNWSSGVISILYILTKRANNILMIHLNLYHGATAATWKVNQIKIDFNYETTKFAINTVNNIDSKLIALSTF